MTRLQVRCVEVLVLLAWVALTVLVIKWWTE